MAEADPPASGAPGREPLRTIQDVATELGVSARTLRFYETKGLIDLQRVGAMRVYSRREVARLQLILRGKRLGFSLREIQQFLDLYDADPQHAEQMRRLIGRVQDRLAELEGQRAAIDETVAELREIEREATVKLSASG